MNDVEHLQAAIAEARVGLAEGGIPIGAALVVDDEVIAVGHNKRVQEGSAIKHGETDCLENAGRLPATVYARATMVTTLSPCDMCTGAILLVRHPPCRRRREPHVLRRRGPAARPRRRGRRPRQRGVQGDDGGVHRRQPVAVERGHRRTGLTSVASVAPMAGVIAIVLAVLLVPVLVLMAGGVLSGVLGQLLGRDADARYEGSELLNLDD